MKAHPTGDDLIENPLRPDVQRHLDQCAECRVEHVLLSAVHDAEGTQDHATASFEERYRLGPVEGRGPRSTIHRAFDMELGRHIALKQLSGPVDRARLARVKHCLDRLSHPHVSKILDIPQTERPTYTRPWIDGRSLSKASDAPAPTRHAWLSQVAAAVASLHAAGLVHGALHGENIRISATNQVHVVDAGVGAALEGDLRAPELEGPLDASFAADWYAVGVLFAEGPLPALTRRMRSADPADRPSATEVLAALLIERDPAMEGHGRYRRLALLGRGGMGEVHKVEDPVLNRQVALKSMRLELLDSEEAQRRFRTEAQVTAQLEHPGVIPVHEMGQLADGSPYFTMKQMGGDHLGAVLQQAATDPTWSTRRGVDILIRASEAVAYAHSRSVIHRDLKPANIMVGDFGEVLVLDWGLAKILSDDPDGIEAELGAGESQSRPGIGTPGYMPLEQAKGGDVGPQSDVFALGAILSEVLDLDPASPAPLRAIADKAQRKDPAQRYPDAQALAADLKTWRAGGLVEAYDYSPVERIGRRLRPYQAPLLVAAVATAVVTVVGAAGALQVSTHQRKAKENLAQSLVEKSQLAFLANDRIHAEAYAAAAVDLDDRPEARGLLARLRRVPYPSLIHAVPTPCDALASAGEWATCRTGEEVVGHSATGTPWTGEATRVWPGPPGHILLERPDRLHVVDERTGEVQDETPLEGPLVGAAALEDGLVLATAEQVWRVGGASDDDRLPRGEVVQLIRCGPEAVVFKTATRSLYRWEPGSEPEVLSIRARDASALACDPTGSRIALAVGNAIPVWSLDSQIQTANLVGHNGPVRQLDWSDTHIASGGQDGTVRLWDPGSWTERARLPFEGVEGLAFHGDRLWVAGRAGLQLWELPHEQRVDQFDAVVDLRAVDWPAPDRVITIDANGDWRRTSSITGRSDARIALAGIPPAAISTTRDGASVAVGLADGRLVRLDEYGDIVWETQVAEGPITAVAIAPGGDRILAGLESGALKELSPDGDLRATWAQEDGDPIRSLRLSLDGHRLVAVRASQRVDRFTDGRHEARLPDGRSATLSRDGQVVALHQEDGSVIVQHPGHQLALPRAEAQAIALSPDGDLLATASSRLIKVWSTQDGSEVARLVAHARGAVGLAFSPDGGGLATAGRDGQVHMWDLGPVRADSKGILRDVQHRYGPAATDLYSAPGEL